MFIRFFSGEVDERSHVPAGLFCAASALFEADDLPEHELEALFELQAWFNVHLKSPFDYLPSASRYNRAICWFKSTAQEHLARAWELIAVLERNDVLIWTIKSSKAGLIHYEDDAQVFAEPFHDAWRIL